MSELQIHTFTDRETLDEQLATRVSKALGDAVAERGKASLVVSGGSTPAGFFAALSCADLPWSEITVTLADERWVGPEHDDSNERLVRTQLLCGAAADARFLSLYTGAEDPERAEDSLATALGELGTFDAVVLGMGGDGHTASLFPGSDALVDGLNPARECPCIAVRPLAAPHARMSLTLARLLDARLLLIHITSEDKRAVLEIAQRDMDPTVLPIAAVLAATSPAPLVYWAP
ncbi:MAG: 6-phosphogluconolactonase [Halieaceae bacterium]|jgi:6-phosphogluconolactonase